MPGTQWPGQLGNFAIAGHRVTAGNPFWSLPSLRDGDLVYIETRLNDYIYRVTGKKRVAPTDTSDTSGARMYAWLWRRLPGRTPARAGVLTLIILAVAAALGFYVFPRASLHLPIDSSGFTG